MRPPPEMPPPHPSARRRRLRVPHGRARTVLIVVLVGVFVLATSLRGIARYYTDFLWFDSVGARDVWSHQLQTRVALVLVFGLVFFTLMWTNLAVAERLSGNTLRFGGTSEDEVVLRYRELVGPRRRLVRGLVAGALAVVAGTGVSGQWESWLLFRNRQTVGVRDATFGLDAGFYMFQLPFLRFVSGWLFSSLVVVLLVTVIVHYLNGGIRLQASTDRVSPQAKAHISVLLAALALVRAGQYLLDRYQLVFSHRGPVNGAAYTDVNVQLRAIYLLVLISLFATALFIINIWRRGWVLPVMAVGLWALVAVLAGELVPAFVQRFRVETEVSSREAPYIEQNIVATRYALGLDGIEERSFAADGELTGEQLRTAGNADIVRNIRLWDPEEVQAAFQRLQAFSPFYEIGDVDVGRYEVDGETRQVMLALRQLDDAGIPNQGWESTRLVYTSGYGAVMAPANAKTSDGQPSLVLRDIPQSSQEAYPGVDRPSLYFGEGQGGYKIVNTSRNELEYQREDGDSEYEKYQGADGVALDSTLRRAAFALRFGDIEPLISSSVQPTSRILVQRDVVERVHALAPFLQLDHDPYAVLLDGRVVYVIDAYTTSAGFPNAQAVEADADIPLSSGLSGDDFNYIRNPVKAVVDAYDGTVNLYVTDPDEPVLAAYRQAFPDLFEPIEDAPAGLQDHFRYPEDLFRVQTSMWGKYHIDDADQFLQGSAAWEVAADPDATESETTTTPSTTENAADQPPVAQTRAGIEPTYQMLKLPGDDTTSFVLLRPFTPVSRGQLTAFLTATPDGHLVNYSMPSDRLPNGPAVAAAGMQQDDEVARVQVQLGQEQNDVTFGNALLVPIEQSILYVRSMYITNDSARVPRITRVVVSFQDGPDSNRVAVGHTLDEALIELFGGSPGTLEDRVTDPPDETPGPSDDPTSEDPTTPPGTFDGTDDELLQRIQDEFDQADAALAENDLGAYQEHVNEAQRLVGELAARREAAGSGSTTTEPAGEAPSTTDGSGGAPPTTPTTGTTGPDG